MHKTINSWICWCPQGSIHNIRICNRHDQWDYSDYSPAWWPWQELPLVTCIPLDPYHSLSFLVSCPMNCPMSSWVSFVPVLWTKKKCFSKHSRVAPCKQLKNSPISQISIPYFTATLVNSSYSYGQSPFFWGSNHQFMDPFSIAMIAMLNHRRVVFRQVSLPWMQQAIQPVLSNSVFSRREHRF